MRRVLSRESGHTPIDLRLSEGGRIARLTCCIDDESRAFETELVKQVQLSLPQRQAYLAAHPRAYRLFQMLGCDGKPAMQVAMQIYRPTRLRKLSRAIAMRMGPALSAEDERAGLRLLRRLCAQAGDIMTLRLQCLRDGSAPGATDRGALAMFESAAASAGFKSVAPLSYTRTLKLDLGGSLEEVIMAQSKKSRAKLRHRTRDEIDLRALTDPAYIPQCRDALSASFARTGGNLNDIDLDAVFALAASHPEHVRIFGIFLPDQPEKLRAFVVGRHAGGDLAEYAIAGSLSCPELRKIPFNYLQIWELIQWAHGRGAKWLDLGGITPGGADDPRASISEFKRHLSENELEVGSEMIIALQPVRAFLFERFIDLRKFSAARKSGAAATATPARASQPAPIA